MKMQNNDPNSLESRSVRSKVKEIAAISVFVTAAAIASITLADLVVYPLTRFAVQNVDIFNLLFKDILLVIIIFILLFNLVKKYRILADEGLQLKSILLYFIKRPLHHAGLTVSFILISAILAALLYFLFSMNYYYLYKISGGV